MWFCSQRLVVRCRLQPCSAASHGLPYSSRDLPARYLVSGNLPVPVLMWPRCITLYSKQVWQQTQSNSRLHYLGGGEDISFPGKIYWERRPRRDTLLGKCSWQKKLPRKTFLGNCYFERCPKRNTLTEALPIRQRLSGVISQLAGVYYFSGVTKLLAVKYIDSLPCMGRALQSRITL